MNRTHSLARFWFDSLSGRLLLLVSVTPLIGSAADVQKDLAYTSRGLQVECITTDGRATKISAVTSREPAAGALRTRDAAISTLPEGETDLVVALPSASSVDRLTFTNQNAAARGELRISVSNQRLPANSRDWTQVDGTVAFSKKRLFDVSLLGVEAKFVKLSFHIEKDRGLDALGVVPLRESNGPKLLARNEGL